jgi:hypothetical protein
MGAESLDCNLPLVYTILWFLRAIHFTCCLLRAGFLLGLYFDPEDGRDMFLRFIGRLSLDKAALYPRSWFCWKLTPLKNL